MVRPPCIHSSFAGQVLVSQGGLRRDVSRCRRCWAWSQPPSDAGAPAGQRCAAGMVNKTTNRNIKHVRGNVMYTMGDQPTKQLFIQTPTNTQQIIRPMHHRRKRQGITLNTHRTHTTQIQHNTTNMHTNSTHTRKHNTHDTHTQHNHATNNTHLQHKRTHTHGHTHNSNTHNGVCQPMRLKRRRLRLSRYMRDMPTQYHIGGLPRSPCTRHAPNILNTSHEMSHAHGVCVYVDVGLDGIFAVTAQCAMKILYTRVASFAEY